MTGSQTKTRHSWFRHFAENVALTLGKPAAFLMAFSLVLAWGIAGPFYHYSEQWQIVINTGTTIITFLMVFLLQSTQMRDSTAIHLKMNELLRAVGDARNNLVALEKMPDAQLQVLREEFTKISDDAQARDAAHESALDELAGESAK